MVTQEDRQGSDELTADSDPRLAPPHGDNHQEPGTTAPGWYPDPERVHTVRYWDGREWTDQRAPATDNLKAHRDATFGPLLLTFILTSIGALVATVGTFLPAADISIEFPFGGNSLIQHADGAIVMALALVAATLAGVLAFSKKPNLTVLIPVLLCGGGITGLAVLYGTHLPLEPNNHLSAIALKENPPTAGAGVWATAIGGALIMLSAIVGGIWAVAVRFDSSEQIARQTDRPTKTASDYRNIILALVGAGAFIAAVGLFLPMAENESAFVQDLQIPLVILAAFSSALLAWLATSTFRPTLLFAVLAGGSVIAVNAMFYGMTSEISGAQTGTWTTGIGGVLIAFAAIVGMEVLNERADANSR